MKLVLALVVFGWTAAVLTVLWQSRPSARYREIVPTEEDVANERYWTAKRQVAGKGWGVVARRDIPRWTMIGPYPGMTCSIEDHMQLKERGVADDEYAIEFWKSRPGKKIKETMIVNPKFYGTISDRFECVTPFVNEPDADKTPNLAWVWNFPRRRVEMWTARPVKKGQELTICYGQYYHRGYKSSCQQAGVEYSRYVIGDESQDRPRLWYQIVNDDVDPRPAPA